MLPTTSLSTDDLSSEEEMFTCLSKTAPVIHIMEKYPTAFLYNSKRDDMFLFKAPFFWNWKNKTFKLIILYRL